MGFEVWLRLRHDMISRSIIYWILDDCLFPRCPKRGFFFATQNVFNLTHFNFIPAKLFFLSDVLKFAKDHIRVVTRYMRSGINGLGAGSGITAPGSGITTLGIGISSVFVESGIKIVNIFGIRDQNSQGFCDQGLKFSTFLGSGIKIWGKNTGSVMKKNTLLRPYHMDLLNRRFSPFFFKGTNGEKFSPNNSFS